MRYSDENGGVRKNRPAPPAERRSHAPAERLIVDLAADKGLEHHESGLTTEQRKTGEEVRTG